MGIRRHFLWKSVSVLFNVLGCLAIGLVELDIPRYFHYPGVGGGDVGCVAPSSSTYHLFLTLAMAPGRVRGLGCSSSSRQSVECGWLWNSS